FGVTIHAFYGSSETGGISFDDADDPGDTGTVGRLLPGVAVTLRIADCGMRTTEGTEDTEPDPESAINPQSAIRNPQFAGRIHVVSDAVSSGYVDDDRGDFDRGDFVDGGFLTGDYGAFDAGERLTLIGRVSSFVNVAGKKVRPEEVEHALRE